LICFSTDFSVISQDILEQSSFRKSTEACF